MKLVAISVILVLTLIPFAVTGQVLPQSDDFNYGSGNDLEFNGNWDSSGLPGGELITIYSSGLSYSGGDYPGEGVGLSALFGTDRQAIGFIFSSSAVTSGTVYYSMMIKVDSASASGSHIVSMANVSYSEAQGMLYVQDAGTGWKFGVKKSPAGVGGVSYTSGTYTKGDVHVVVVSYTFSGSDDIVKLWVNPDLSGSEPTRDVEITDNSTGDATGGRYLYFPEQASSLETYFYIDGVRVAQSWSNAPLPVQLTNFAAIAGRSGVDLTWSTATELNNYGFEIERRMVSGSEFQVSGSNNDAWTVVGFVRGAGTSTAPQEYSYSDFGLDAGRYAYRIKQIDFGGAYTYYSAAEVEVGAMPNELALEPNYPNPFNPSTSISFTVPQDGPAVLKVFNMLGQEVATLFNEEAVAGRLYKATFDASSLPTGVYVSRLEFGGQAVMRKMLFVK